GDAADSAAPQHDGVTNLMKFATGMNPAVPGVMPGVLAQEGDERVFIYTRSKEAANAGVNFTVEWNDTLAPEGWTRNGVSESIIHQGSNCLVRAIVPWDDHSHRFVRLSVSSP